jgi:hypothetical protein
VSIESVVGILFYTYLGIQSAMTRGCHVSIFYDTLGLVLPGTGKRIRDFGTEKGVAMLYTAITDISISEATYKHQF